jgi:hypothetical protein
VAVVLAAATLYPPLWSFGTLGPRAIFGHFAADSFYYLTIARNALDGPFPSFDGTNLTNGFHPLWQLLLAGLFRAVGRQQEAQLAATFLLGAALVAAGVVLFGLAALRATRSRLAPLALVPGLFPILFTLHAFRTRDLGLTYGSSVWAFMNGMESPLTILLGGGIALVLSGPSRGAAIDPAEEDRRDGALGLLLGLVTLARLDDALLAVAFLLVAAARPDPPRRKLARAIRLAAPAGAALVAALAAGRAVTGLWLPASAAGKLGLALGGNLLALGRDLLPPLGSIESLEWWNYTAQRSILLVGPALLAAALLLARRRASWPPSLAPFAPLLVYVLLKAAFLLAAVPLTDQGYWYASLAVLAIDLALALTLHDVAAAAGRPARVTAGAALAFLYLFTSANALHRVAAPNWWHEVWRDRAAIRAEILAKVPEARLLEFYDGLFAYSLELPGMTATGLVADRAARRAIAEDRYLEECLARGHDVVVTGPEMYRVFPDWDARLDGTLVLDHPATGVRFGRVSLKPRPPPAPPRSAR